MTARSLGAVGRGEMTIIMLTSSLVIIIAGCGFGWLARHEVGADRYSADFWRRRALTVSCLAVPLALAVAVAIGAILQLQVAEFAALAVLMALSATAALRSVDANVLIAIDRAPVVGIINLLSAITTVVIVLVTFATNSLDLTAAIVSNIGGIGIQVGLLFWVTRASTRTEGERYRLRARQLSANPDYRGIQMMRRASRAWVAQIVDAGISKSDTIVSLASAAPRNIGLYSGAALIPQIAFAFVLTMIQRSYAKNPRITPIDRLRILQQASVALAIVLVATGAPSAFFLLPWLLGQEFLAARTYIPAASVATIGLVMIAPVIQFNSSGREPIWRLIAIVVPALSAGLILARTSSIETGVTVCGSILAVSAVIYSSAVAGRRLFFVDWREIALHFRGDK